jgi:hypothetical protein
MRVFSPAEARFTMQKAEAEGYIRKLAQLWATECGIEIGVDHASFSDFATWVRAKGFGAYLDFQSVRGAEADTEAWFDEELRQSWRT